MLTIHTQANKRITPERIALAAQIFDAAGFDDGVYQMPETIELAAGWILANLDKLQTTLPKHVLGNIAQHVQASKHSRRTLMGFLRRLAQFLEGNVLAKRIQYKKNGRNTCKYCYKVIV